MRLAQMVAIGAVLGPVLSRQIWPQYAAGQNLVVGLVAGPIIAVEIWLVINTLIGTVRS